MTTPLPPPYVSAVPFDAAHPRALAVYCSDGRFTQPVEDLLRHLGHDRLDTLTLPGGPGLLNFWAGSLLEADQLERAARFLIRGHGIDHAVLLAHAGCGYYRQRFPGRPAAEVKASQLEDLRVAGRSVRAARPGLQVALYYASPEADRGLGGSAGGARGAGGAPIVDRVRFEPVSPS
jgi:hypothetical protein